MSNSRELFNLEMWTLLSDRESARISLLSLETHYKITIGNGRKPDKVFTKKEIFLKSTSVSFPDVSPC